MSNNQYENQDTFELCPHDRENPYMMVSKYIFYATLLSLQCRYILMHLSNLNLKSNICKKEISLILNIPLEEVELSLIQLQSGGWLTEKQAGFLFGGE